MKILIIGLARSGTTALFYKIKEALPGSVGLFEPGKFKDKYKNKDVVAKILFNDYLDKNFTDFSNFDKKILITRDLRDMIVSLFIYFVHLDFWYGSKKFRKVLRLLKEKEKDPASISLISMINEVRRLGGFNTNIEKIKKEIVFSMKFADKHPEFFLVRYEDMVDGKLGALEKYLGFKLDEGKRMEKEYSYLIRSKKYGGWRNWFTEEDVKFFKPLFNPYLKKYGYDMSWKLNKAQKIKSSECSEYFIKNAKDRAFNKDRRNQNITVLLKKPFKFIRENSKTFAKFSRKMRGFDNDPIKREILKGLE